MCGQGLLAAHGENKKNERIRKMKEQDIIRMLREAHGDSNVIRMHGCMHRGIPDVVVFIQGEAVFLEIKIEAMKLSKLQYEFLKKCKRGFVLRVNAKRKLISLESAYEQLGSPYLYDYACDIGMPLVENFPGYELSSSYIEKKILYNIKEETRF